MAYEASPIASRVDALHWQRIRQELDDRGWALTGPLLTSEECSMLACLYDEPGNFRSKVVMSRHGFGQGEYRYFSYPIPRPVEALRTEFYRHLVPIALRWAKAVGEVASIPRHHAEYLAQCANAGQTRPTPLLLRYGPGDYNCLHQDLYGEHVFPLQVAILLAQPGDDFTGGEFVLTEQRPRMQSRAQVIPVSQGEAVIFAVNQRPVQGARGTYRVKMRHGVSALRTGQRHTLGIIFHDAS